MFCRSLAVDKIEESEEQGFYEENSDEEEKELGFTKEAQENEDQPWDSNEKYGCCSKSSVREHYSFQFGQNIDFKWIFCIYK